MSENEMRDDLRNESDWIFALEQALERMESRSDATHTLLQTFMARFGEIPAAPSPKHIRRPSSRHSDTLAPASTASWKKLSLKPSAPSDFNGDRSKGKAFLTSCRTYIRLCPEAFEDEIQQVVWVMSYMKDGRAGRWAARQFKTEVIEGMLPFQEWIDFEEAFRKEFTPLNEEVDAVNILETTAYHQGRKSVDDYLDRFRDLIHDSGYTDPKTIVVKFRRGLDRRISNALAGMTSGRPSDTDPEAWFRLAVQMDQNRAADEAFYATQRAAPSAPIPSRSGLLSLPRPSPPTRFAHTTPSPGNPVPMDIDAMRRAKPLSNACRRCGATGHWAKDCHLRFDVRHMDTDELQTLLENMLAAKDVAPLEPSVEEDNEPVAHEKDFVSRSG